ncbi:phenylalanine--tRNA ligase subunit alpha [Peptoniphilaceae bacterium SGI.137]|nr:phenylalanine--tRNA ligase subunit alpha [Peptoniphilaceae bacterium]MDY3987436.1 phenylalanine--tRNA ligase subunit alpha [Peptoniphilaceae bacterium]MDY5842258.1 phenylalanine--tRNA ligase subunit alpha [Peptoniphilaceae bacterium]
MIAQLNELFEEAQKRIEKAASNEELDALRVEYLGKKGRVTEILKNLKSLAPEMKKEVGQKANAVKQALHDAIHTRQDAIINESPVIQGTLDLTRPGMPVERGALHPITQMMYDLNDAFRSLGFEIFSEDDITSEKYAFDNLNFPPNHPARETMDTYWLAGTEEKHGAERLALRPHLTGASVRYLQRHGAPARFVYPGRVYRNETTDAKHERTFTQYEALIVDKDFSFASGQLLIDTILEKVFGHPVRTRMRAGFFPFVEPGFEIDMECQVCHGRGCRTCQQVGWLEVMPGGSPHPNVLRAAGLDPSIWSGFYINIGLDRLVMMRYAVEDVRLFYSQDLRFLKQFR